MQKPTDCKSIEEVRNAIDAIDEEIISLLDQRFSYVKEVVKFKKDGDIIAKNRYDQVITSRKQWAAEKGLQPEVIEKVYTLLLNYFIEEEHKIAKQL